MTMFVSALALTSLDAVARIGHLSFQELFEVENSQEASGLIKFYKQVFCNINYLVLWLFITSLVILNIISAVIPDPSNQLLAAMVLISLSVFLKVTGRKGFMLYIPMCTMLVVTLSSFGLSVYNIVNAWMTTGTFSFKTSGLQLIFAILLIAWEY